MRVFGRRERPHPGAKLGRGQLELGQDAADMLFDGALADPQPMGDPVVRAAFGHERQDLPLPRGEHGERVGRRSWPSSSWTSAIRSRGIDEVQGIPHSQSSMAW
jgi:hypothetical protein